jgi:hypothetical protein
MERKLNRTIGYVRPETRKTVLEEPATPKVENKLTEEIKESVHQATAAQVNIEQILATQKIKSLKIVKWINGHKKFKWGAMCLELGIDKGNFQRTLKSNEPEIKLEHIHKIEENLKPYGYAQ